MLKEQNIKQAELELIKKMVTENPYYEGNEDLLPIFCEEVYSKSYLLFKSVKNYSYLSSYIAKIVNSSIIAILKKHSRTRKLSSVSFMSKNNDSDSSSLLPEAAPIKGRYVYDIYKVEDPISPDMEFVPDKDVMKKMVQLVQFINSENLDRNYLNIFIDRYIYNKSIESTAVSLRLSENEVMQRLLILADIISDNLNTCK